MAYFWTRGTRFIVLVAFLLSLEKTCLGNNFANNEITSSESGLYDQSNKEDDGTGTFELLLAQSYTSDANNTTEPTTPESTTNTTMTEGTTNTTMTEGTTNTTTTVPTTPEATTTVPTTTEPTTPEATTTVPTTPEATTTVPTTPEATTTVPTTPEATTTVPTTPEATTTVPTTPEATTTVPTTPEATTTEPTTQEQWTPEPTTAPITSGSVTSTTPKIKTTVIPTTSTTSSPPRGCTIKCTKTDSDGFYWSVCGGIIGAESCSRVVTNSTGQITWECLSDGKFATEQPDSSKCTTSWMEEFLKESGQVTNTTTAVEYLKKLQEKVSLDSSSSESNYFGHEIGTLNEILANVTKTVSNSTMDSDAFFQVATWTVRIAQKIIKTPEPWLHLAVKNRSHLATNLTVTIEDTSFLLTSKVKVAMPGPQSLKAEISSDSTPFFYKDIFNEPQFTVTSLAYPKIFPGLDNLKYPFVGNQNSVIRLPPRWTDLVAGQKIECVGMFMDANYASLIMPGQFDKLGFDTDMGHKKILNGDVMSFTVASSSPSQDKLLVGENDTSEKIEFEFKDQGVQIIFRHDFEAWGNEAFDIPRKLYSGEKPKAVQGTAQCVFWDTKKLEWSQKGCKMVSSTKSETICECNHLTSFAVLMDMHNYVGKNACLEVLTLILVPISILCLGITIVIFFRIRMARSQRTIITRHLAICLAVGNLLVLLVLDKSYFNLSQGLCVASGILIHYSFLAAFGWMGVQGVHLYRMVVDIFNVKSSFLIFRLVSYGGPLIIIAVTAMAGYLSGDEPYGGEVVCWLNGSYMWAFMGPVLIIVILNTVILSLSLWKSYRIRIRSDASISSRRVSSLRTWIQGSFALTIILGITWLIGFLMMTPQIPGTVAAYFFTLLNASQGIFIFIFDCFLNEKVRQGIHRQYGRSLPVRLDTWLKKTSTSSLGITTNASVNISSTVRKRKLSSSSESTGRTNSSRTNSDRDSLPPVPPPRKIVQEADSISSQVKKPNIADSSRENFGVTSNIWEGPVNDDSIPPIINNYVASAQFDPTKEHDENDSYSSY